MHKSGYKIVVYSGGQVSKADGGVDGVNRTGSNRHDNGYAADIRVFDGSTRLSAENSSTFDRLSKFVKLLQSEGIEGIGAGPGYMNGNLHVDIAASVGQGPSQHGVLVVEVLIHLLGLKDHLLIESISSLGKCS